MAVRSSPRVRALPWPLAPLFAAEGPLPAREGALGGVGRWTGHWSTRPRKAFLNNQDCLIYPTNRGKGSFMLMRNILRDAKRGPPPLLPLLPWPWTPPWKPGSGTPGVECRQIRTRPRTEPAMLLGHRFGDTKAKQVHTTSLRRAEAF